MHENGNIKRKVSTQHFLTSLFLRLAAPQRSLILLALNPQKLVSIALSIHYEKVWRVAAFTLFTNEI